MKQNIGRGEFSQFPNLSQTSCQEDDVSTYVQHLNALYSDFESRFEDILSMVIPPWIINPYGDIEETNVIIQEELTELSTNEDLKVQFKNGSAILAAKQHTRYLSRIMEYSEEIFSFLSIVIPSGKGVQRCYQSPTEKKKQTGHHYPRGFKINPYKIDAKR
ncbi:unnamed protein product [Acanthoscelides obtectus]|uniref:Uncharacterized protein n=1 Tax=Acanthoscelides obtectus TaxID=200917 RepID=A0A9P0KWE0_ACAOB|nr:unnamed protein product [Acanthoscelides obtectus]CAK1654548.1 hypothetical protein AOBTE_LOCUS18668 [Acanthoscelides obtectus]